ncbi:hypothetical protein AAFF_G00110830 [Aldrovandia affinis]|uniref:SprT-like domain-containing protein n=1 Tax=Aldrovandia affinis TaxID=143900 RepID=A0AAD7RTF4_9TELE|nr:hypothetical protein AAFF_G00110830 [Aldrovandia affinis]
MDSDTHGLFKRVAGKLGWTGPGGLESAEKELKGRIGKSRRPATGGLDLDSSNDYFDQFLEKATTKTAPRQPLCLPQINSPSVHLLSSDSDSDSSFEKFLSQVKTPKSKPVAAAVNSSDDSLKHFIVNSFSSDDDDFATERKKKPAPRSKPKTPKSLQTLQPVARRPPSQWESPVFLSDSGEDEDEGVVIRSTWKSRHTPRRPRSAEQQSGGREHEHKYQTHRAPPPLDDSASSEEEFLSLIERLKRNNSVGSNRKQGPNGIAAPKHKPCLSVPAGCDLGGVGPRKAEKGARIDRTPVQPTSTRPHVSLTEPRPTLGSRVVLCKTPGCFLQSLSVPGSQYCRSFKQNKEGLTSRLYQLYNSSVFDGKLPSDMSVSWNKKLRKTAGYCITGQERAGGSRYARIQLSEKVCDSADRLRDTLVHEMCHAATWLINEVRDGHGPFWKVYAHKAKLAHPELPMVTRCHSYDINYKFQYQCSRCKNTIGRHSKSLDTQRFVCALCTGQLVLLTPAKPRAATPFANFVKDNYKTVRQDLGGQSHAEVMRKLSVDFASKTRLSQS